MDVLAGVPRCNRLEWRVKVKGRTFAWELMETLRLDRLWRLKLQGKLNLDGLAPRTRPVRRVYLSRGASPSCLDGLLYRLHL